MIPPTIHRVWLGGNLPPPLEINHFWTMMWTEQNVHLLDIKPEEWEHSTYAGSSNIIRLHAVRKFGGIYMDTDCEVVGDLKPLLLNNAFCARQASDPNITCNAVFGATPNHPWILRMIEAYKGREKESADVGCYIMEECLGPDVTVLPTDWFYPYNWNEKPKPPTENTIIIHKWEGSWTK